MARVRQSHRAGFTLIELLVVIGVIAILIALLIPAVQKVREASNRATCASHFKQIALGTHAFESTHGRLPYNIVGTFPESFNVFSYNWSWLALTLPFVEQDNLYRQGNIPTQLLAASGVLTQPVTLFFCPSDAASQAGLSTDRADLAPNLVALSNYKGVNGSLWCFGDWPNRCPPTFPADGQWYGTMVSDGVFRFDNVKIRITDITDGTANTLMVGEDLPSKSKWGSWPYANGAVSTCAIPLNVRRSDGSEYSPNDWFNVYSFRSRHPGGAQFAYADGHVGFMANKVDLQLYRNLATIRGGEVASEP